MELTGTWTAVCPLEELTGPKRFLVGGRAIVVWRTDSGRLSALDDRCPHQSTALSSGTVVDEELICVGHGWSVGIDGWCDLAGAGTRSHPVEERDGVVHVLAAVHSG
ncbi:MAG TPA: Rieske 2Fe-2S domain-containing protein [Mycobacteriales bacterium]|nr:Rieske 2Fe-2S domain-containing protein [Mycobacteriales bacterium]